MRPQNIRVPQSMDAVNDLRKIFLLIKVGEFEYEALFPLVSDK